MRVQHRQHSAIATRYFHFENGSLEIEVVGIGLPGRSGKRYLRAAPGGILKRSQAWSRQSPRSSGEVQISNANSPQSHSSVNREGERRAEAHFIQIGSSARASVNFLQQNEVRLLLSNEFSKSADGRVHVFRVHQCVRPTVIKEIVTSTGKELGIISDHLDGLARGKAREPRRNSEGASFQPAEDDSSEIEKAGILLRLARPA